MKRERKVMRGDANLILHDMKSIPVLCAEGKRGGEGEEQVGCLGESEDRRGVCRNDSYSHNVASGEWGKV